MLSSDSFSAFMHRSGKDAADSKYIQDVAEEKNQPKGFRRQSFLTVT